MDSISDAWKKYPLLVAGDLPVAPPGAHSISLSGGNYSGPLQINDFYIILALPCEEIGNALACLEAAAVSPDQVIAFLPADVTFIHPQLAFLGLLENIPGESADEFRIRLFGKLECQRHKRLPFALHEAAEGGIARRLNERELLEALDTARLAHALSCGYGLSPEKHTKILRASLKGPQGISPAPWASDSSVEKLLVETAQLILKCAIHGGSFRDALKEHAVALPFRTRTELLHHVESSLGLLLGGKGHAA